MSLNPNTINQKTSLKPQDQFHLNFILLIKLATLARDLLDCKSFDFSKDIFSKTAEPISIKFYMKCPDYQGTKVCSNDPCHMTKMAAMPKHGKIFSRTTEPFALKLGMKHQVTENYKFCSNDVPRLTLTYSTARSDLSP